MVSKHWKNSFHYRLAEFFFSFSHKTTELREGKQNWFRSPQRRHQTRGTLSEHKTHMCKTSTKNALFNSEKLPRYMIIQKSKLDSSKNDWDPRGHRIWAAIITADDKTELKAVQNSKTTYKNTATRSLTSDLVLQLHPMLCPLKILITMPIHGLQGSDCLDTTQVRPLVHNYFRFSFPYYLTVQRQP